jgi:hypothetical protein
MPPLTPNQKCFIKDNYKKMTHQAIADRIKVPVGKVRQHCYYNRYDKAATVKHKPPPSSFVCSRVAKSFEKTIK